MNLDYVTDSVCVILQEVLLAAKFFIWD